MQEPGARNAEGNTPLHYACLNGHVAIVRQLMMNGANASELNRYGNTCPSSIAVKDKAPHMQTASSPLQDPALSE